MNPALVMALLLELQQMSADVIGGQFRDFADSLSVAVSDEIGQFFPIILNRASS